ncbi:MAG: response regulator [Candidatus Aureabacteria bacterium]|nr:response regulator [Candidatus Auribacterota bacterium]
MKILVIDDSGVHRKIVKSFLRSAGHEDIKEAQSGKEGLTLLEGIDFIITDLMMPEMSGIEFIKEVRKENKDVLILVSTSISSVEEELGEIGDLGACDYIIKPFTKPQIKEKIEDFIKQYRKDFQKEEKVLVPAMEEKVNFQEQRHHVRFDYDFKVMHRTVGTEKYFEALSENISMGDMVFMSQHVYENGEMLDLKLNFPETKDIIPSMTFQAKVIWSVPAYKEVQANQIGVQFDYLTEEQKEFIKQLIQIKDELTKEK